MDGQTGKRPIIYWADLIRVVAIYLVVMIHVSGQITNEWGQIPDGQWMIGNIYSSVARISVPLFFMISGYLLLPRSRDECTGEPVEGKTLRGRLSTDGITDERILCLRGE